MFKLVTRCAWSWMQGFVLLQIAPECDSLYLSNTVSQGVEEDARGSECRCFENREWESTPSGSATNCCHPFRQHYSHRRLPSWRIHLFKRPSGHWVSCFTVLKSCAPCFQSVDSVFSELPAQADSISSERIRETFDFTGMFFWQPKRPVDDAVLSIHDASNKNLQHHVVVCVFGDPDSPPIGLRNFVMPLRSSNRSPFQLKPIVFVGDLRYLRCEWEQISTFPAIYILPVSVLSFFSFLKILKCKFGFSHEILFRVIRLRFDWKTHC